MDKLETTAAPGVNPLGAARPRRGSAAPWANYLYLVPIFAFVGGLIYYTIYYTAEVSLFDWNGLTPDRDFVGLDNYTDIVRDPVFHTILVNTVIFAVLTIFIQMALGLLIAVLLKFQVAFKTLYKIIFFLPVVTAPAITAFIFRRIYSGEGELNQTLTALGLGRLTQVWLADPDLALFSVAAINIWHWTGFSFLLYFAALTMIDRSIYEAALIDGANFFQTLRHITLPLLKPTHFTLITLGVIGSLKTFDVVYLTTGGGPGRATELMATYIFKKSIAEFDVGYASALSIVLLLLAVTITVVQQRFYES